MSTQGTAEVDFGTGKLDTSVAVTGQAAITTSNIVEAWMNPNATADNLNGASFAEELLVEAGDIVDATGFTIYARCVTGKAYGKFKVNWVWN